jgi:hypothetical protein
MSLLDWQIMVCMCNKLSLILYNALNIFCACIHIYIYIYINCSNTILFYKMIELQEDYDKQLKELALQMKQEDWLLNAKENWNGICKQIF